MIGVLITDGDATDCNRNNSELAGSSKTTRRTRAYERSSSG